MTGSEGFTRRVSAVMLADVADYSALVGRDDERTARAVEALHVLVQETVAEARGLAEQHAGDALLATFDSVVAAVEVALRIQHRLANEQVAGVRLRMRIGVHLGDVVLREGASVGKVVGDAVNLAARLQALAHPGTVCVSDGVYRQVRSRLSDRVIDLGRRQLKNISGPVHAYLIVPEGVEIPRGLNINRIRPVWIGVPIAAIAAAVLAAYWISEGATNRSGTVTSGGAEVPRSLTQPRAGDEARKTVLGVMAFRARGADTPQDWRCDALRDGLNSQLSQLSTVKVYSKEFIDFLVSRQGLTEIEAANKLGITKMLTGSFFAVGGTLHIETHIVDVGSGVLDASHTTTGPEGEFLALQTDVVLGLVDKLDLPISEEDRHLLATRRTNTVEGLKLLLEAEGQSSARHPQGAAPPDDGHSFMPAGGPILAFLEAAAHADENPDAEAGVRGLLERYREAMVAKNLESVVNLYASLSPAQRSAQERYFANVSDLDIEISDVDVVVIGDEAIVSYTRIDDFLDRRTGREMHVNVRLTKKLKKEAGDWKFVAQD